MKKIKDMRIGMRLAAAFALVLAFTFVVTLVGVARLQELNDATHDMDGTVHKMRLSEQWKELIVSNNALTQARLLIDDAEDDMTLAARMKQTSAVVTKIQAELKPLLVTEKGKQLFEATASRRQEFVAIRDQVFQMKNDPAKDQAALDALVEKMRLAMTAYELSVSDVTRWQEKLLSDAKNEVESKAASGKVILLACGAAALIVGVLLAWLLTRSITVPLRKAVVVAQTVADGDLSMTVEVASKDETGLLMAALQEMTSKLNTIVGSVRASSDTIATASAEVASGNLDLSSRTEQQASSIEETAASIEELSTTVQNNAENARQGNQVAVSASEIATKGGEVVAQVVDTMGEINKSAKKIVDIISVIDGIAFQTNILALNAAVEAARAGEQGRGFAVVAGEVRTLAQRSAAAAKEIKMLIDDSVGKVDAGTMLVNEAGATISEVVESVKRVTAIMSEIATASHEQSEGIVQVNEAIRQMDQVTQQNAALVEEAAAATESMQDEAQQLAEAVSVFKLDHQAAQSPVPTLRTPVKPAAPSLKPALKAPRREVPVHRGAASQAVPAAEFEQF